MHLVSNKQHCFFLERLRKYNNKKIKMMKQANKQTSKQANKQTSKQAIKNKCVSRCGDGNFQLS
jgi:hypothetical protein